MAAISAGTIMGIISLLAQLTGGGIAAGKANKQDRNEKKLKAHSDEVAEFEEKQQKEADRERRRQALARAIGSDATFAPSPTAKGPEAPTMESTTGLDVASGISNVVGQGAAGAQGMMGGKAAPSSEGILSGSTAAGQSTYQKPMEQPGDFTAPMGDPLASSGNKYKRFADKNFRYS
jgi:hypothetical protein